MNTLKIRPAIAGIVAMALCLSATAKARDNSVDVSIDFGSPSEYTDIETGALTSQKDKHYVLDLIRDEFLDNANRYLPSGYTLEVNIQDIDLAGEYEFFYTRYDDTRIMRSVYPPRLKFSYLIRDDEIIVEQGEESLIDLNYLWTATPLSQRNETAYYVKTLVADWLRSDIARKLK